MTYRKQMVIVIIVILFLTIISNSLISGQFINRYFNDYIEDQYEKDVNAIEKYAENILSGEVGNLIQANIELTNYLNDSIAGIEIFDDKNRLIIDVKADNYRMPHMMKSRLGFDEVVHTIILDEEVIGYLKLEKIKSVGNSETAVVFRLSMIRSIVISGTLSFLLSLLIIGFVSKRMTRDLINTVQMANTIDSNKNLSYKKSKIKEVRAIQSTLVDLAAKLKIKEGIRKEKADRLAHEARTPLTVLQSNLEGIVDGVVESDDERFKILLSEVDRLAMLIENIGDIVDFGKNDIKPNLLEVDVNEIVEKVIQSMKPQFQLKGIEFGCSVLSEKNLIFSDENLIAQSLYNLLSNAYKYTDAGGNVAVEVFEKGADVVIAVKDTGCGLSGDEIENIFNPYFRGSNSETIDGLGMGLYIVRENMRAVDGNVFAKKNSNKGMTFTLEFKKS
ncbi:MAG: HAMP domain-containing sensor histidine kinase [Bacillota bacterium]|nr:HAMP domain-containing sensor histidine kinase [Bacillota bacterium]